MILALVGVFWLDQFVSERPSFFAGAGEGGAARNMPAGLVLLIAGIALAPLAAWELKQLLRAAGIMASRGMMTAAAITGLLVPALISDRTNALTAVAATASAATGVYVAALVWHTRARSIRGVTAAAGAALLSFVYLGLMSGFILAMRREHSAWIVLGVLVVTKSCDIGAFATGKLIGRHKLILWLSPGKTWEGLVGGVLAAAAFGTLGAWLLSLTHSDQDRPGIALWLGGLYGGIFAVTGQVGDLMASMLKRDAGLKDSSSVVPGFGGMLDVIDSVLPVAPVAYWLLHRV
jgi:phosphatidate cytidylyltransferase